MAQNQKDHLMIISKFKQTKVLVMFFLIALMFLIGSWENEKKNTPIGYPETKLTQARNNFMDPIYMPGFVMEKSQVNKYLTKNLPGQEGKGKGKIILRYVFKGMFTDQNNMKVISFWAKNQDDHGNGENNDPYILEPDQHKLQALEIILSQSYILGNNYLNVKKLDKYLKNLEGGENSYNYLRFTPVLPVTSNNLVFKIQACDMSGQVLKQKTFRLTDDEGINTNPSPPGKPGED